MRDWKRAEGKMEREIVIWKPALQRWRAVTTVHRVFRLDGKLLNR